MTEKADQPLLVLLAAAMRATSTWFKLANSISYLGTGFLRVIEVADLERRLDFRPASSFDIAPLVLASYAAQYR